MESTRMKRMKQLWKVLYAVVCGALLLLGKTSAIAATKADYAPEVKRGEEKIYCGVVNTDDLNVRIAAGKENPNVQLNGKKVKLNEKDEVAILDETLSSKEIWYKVSFRLDETLVVGYVHGSYVDLTTDVVSNRVDETPDSEGDSSTVSASTTDVIASLLISIGLQEIGDGNISFWEGMILLNCIGILGAIVVGKVWDYRH